MLTSRLIDYIKKYWPFFFIFLAIVLWIALRPYFFANVDEHHYLRTAFKLARGISLEESSKFQSLGGFLNQDGNFISKYNIGNSLWLAPFSFFGFSKLFFASLIAYVLTILVSYEIIKEIKARKVIMLFVIFNLPLIYFSRTVLSEVPAAFLFSLSVLSFLRFKRGKKYKLLLGFSLGFLTLIRYNFAVWVIVLMLGLGLFIYKEKSSLSGLIKHFMLIFISALPFLSIFLLVNSSLYGGFFNSGYIFSNEQGIDFNLLSKRLPQYILYLNVLYPFQLFVFAIFIRSKEFFKDKTKLLKLLLLIFVVILLLFYSVFKGGFLFQGKITDFISGVRFFVPIFPVVTIFYFDVIFNFLKSKFNNAIFIKIGILFSFFSAIILFFAATFIHIKHHAFISEKHSNFLIINDFACKHPGSLFIGDVEDYIYLGEQFNSPNCFDQNGYINVNNFDLSSSKSYFDQFDKFDQIYVLEIQHSTRTDRPTKALRTFLQNSQIGKQGKTLEITLNSEQNGHESVKIYQLKQLK